MVVEAKCIDIDERQSGINRGQDLVAIEAKGIAIYEKQSITT